MFTFPGLHGKKFVLTNLTLVFVCYARAIQSTKVKYPCWVIFEVGFLFFFFFFPSHSIYVVHACYFRWPRDIFWISVESDLIESRVTYYIFLFSFFFFSFDEIYHPSTQLVFLVCFHSCRQRTCVFVNHLRQIPSMEQHQILWCRHVTLTYKNEWINSCLKLITILQKNMLCITTLSYAKNMFR